MCMHPEYLAKLRDEALKVRNSPLNVGNYEMPYLGSFIRVAARLSPSLSVSLRPYIVIILSIDPLLIATIVSSIWSVMHSYTTNDGCHIPKGN